MSALAQVSQLYLSLLQVWREANVKAADTVTVRTLTDFGHFEPTGLHVLDMRGAVGECVAFMTFNLITRCNYLTSFLCRVFFDPWPTKRTRCKELTRVIAIESG